MSVPMSQVLTTVRTFLNDDNATTFTDQVIIPKIQEAHRELQTELWLVGSPVVRGDFIATLAIGGIVLTGGPTDMLAPTELFEADVGNTNYLPMTEVTYLPQTVVAGPLSIYWSWQRETLLLNPTTVARKIYLRYRKSIAIPVIATDLIGILSGELYLAARAAAIVAGTLANEKVYETMTAQAKENLGKVIISNRGQQKPVNRP